MHKTTIQKYQSGMSLLQVLVGMALVSIILLGSMTLFMNGVEFHARGQTLSAVNYGLTFGTSKFIRDIEQAEAVSTPLLGTASSSITVRMPDITRFYLEKGIIWQQIASATPQQLTSSKVTVTELLFDHIGTSTTPATIRMELSIAATGTRSYARHTATYTTTIHMRRHNE